MKPYPGDRVPYAGRKNPDVIDFSGLTIIADDDLSTKPLHGALGPDELACLFINHWLLLRDCRDCGRPECCRFGLILDDERKRYKLDEPCRAVAALVKNHVRVTYHVLEGLRQNELQLYLDATYHFVKWIDQVEVNTSLYMSDDVLQWFGNETSATLIASYTRARTHLDQAAGLLKQIPAFDTRRGVLLVEGESELTFLNEMRKAHLWKLMHLHVIVYGGQSKRRSARLELFVKQQMSAGYEVFLQGDCDGKGPDSLDDLVSKGFLKREHAFLFKWDFESSVPPALLFFVLVEIKLLSPGQKDKFLAGASIRDRSAIKLLKEQFGVDLDPHKISFARKLGALTAGCRWETDQIMASSELGEFLKFVNDIP